MNNSFQEEFRILKNIERLQDVEKGLYRELENSSNSNSDSIINQINQVSDVRMSLFKSLNYTYKSLQKSVNTSKSELVELMTVVSIIEDELNNAKIQLNEIYGIKTNKMRMVEINTYYKKRYDAQSKLMKLIIVVSLLLFVLATLYKKNLLPEIISKILLVIVIVIGGVLIIWGSLDIYWRDNMNFDAYDYNTRPEGDGDGDYGYKVPALIPIDCVGNACCTDGMMYDDNIRKCIRPARA
jgi:hypothetical protein